MLAETASLDPCGCSRLPEQDPRPLAAAGQEGGPQRTVQRNLHQIPERQRLNTKDLKTKEVLPITILMQYQNNSL